ncbi:MAG: DUF4091 domain-containing protein [Phycisphaerales bacterium]|nr:DUF4091 domain-containing protein [Phycisphaerales bacterium]
MAQRRHCEGAGNCSAATDRKIGHHGGMLLYAMLVTAASFDVTIVDELEPIYPDRRPTTAVTEINVPLGGVAGVHMWIDGVDPEVPIQITASGASDLPAALWYQLIDVPVEENTGPESRTERWDKAENPHVIRDAPFRVYEVLRPIDDMIEHPSDPMAMRVEWAVPASAEAGTHKVDLTILQGEGRSTLPLEVRVHDVAVPAATAQTLGYTNWFSPATIARYHDLDLWSEPFWKMLSKYAALMHRGRQNMFWVRWPDFFDREADRWVLDEDRLKRYVDIFTDAGLHWIEGAPFAGRPGGDWSSPVLELKLGGALMTGETGRQTFSEQAGQVRSVIERHGWSDRWVQHIADEPTDVNAADYAIAAAMVREHLPGLPIFEATMSRELVGAVDMWCPQVQAWQGEQAFFDERVEAGDRVWVYTCLRPGGPWLNRLLDQERLRQVYFGWGAAKNNWDGYLHWGLNHWKADPFAQSVVDHPAMPNTDNRLPAGDTHVIFPGEDGPWSGVRFEAHRIGMEDHAMLTQLSRRDPAAASQVIDRVFRGAEDYELDVQAYRDARRQLLHALEEGSGSMRIEILGFPGCPMTPGLERSVRAACAAVSPEASVVSIDLSKLPQSDDRLRWPAPTVLVNGVDLFGAEPAMVPALACRLYPGGLPTAEATKKALLQRTEH